MKPYQKLPLSLGALVDPSVSEDRKLSIARWFLGLSQCCLCTAFCQPLKAKAQDERDLLEGPASKLLQASFQTKNTNIECETNFARAHSAKMATRGRNDFVHTMAGKHFLSEIKLSHKVSLERNLLNSAASADPEDSHDTPQAVAGPSESTWLDTVLIFLFFWVSFLQICKKM